MSNYLFSSEAVSEGHPDKVADQISDAVLDSCLKDDPYAKCAIETLVAKNLIVLAGESSIIKTDTQYREIINTVFENIKAPKNWSGFDTENYKLVLSISEQSKDINRGVDLADNEVGAGDQGLMFGYAVNETQSLMPLPLSLANELLTCYAEVRKEGRADWLLPDAKSQITFDYKNGRPSTLTHIVFSAQHKDDITIKDVREFITSEIIRKVIPKQITKNTKLYINPTGRFVEGGPQADAGLTGRKIIADTYGGSAPHGGGAFSGKDATKVDRSGAYIARYIAKNIVAAGLTSKCTVQLAYAIGETDPVSVFVDTHGQEKITSEKLAYIIRNNIDLTPRGIIDSLKLRRPIFSKTSSYGHFGKFDPDFTWEITDKKELFQ